MRSRIGSRSVVLAVPCDREVDADYDLRLWARIPALKLARTVPRHRTIAPCRIVIALGGGQTHTHTLVMHLGQ